MTRGVAAFLFLAFAMAWTIWEAPSWLGIPSTGIAFAIVIALGAFAPATAAIVVRKWITREGFADAGLRLDPAKWPYYALALLIPLASAWVVGFAVPALGIAKADFQYATAPVVLQFALFAILATPVLWGEEFGWRGYLQPRLFPGRPLLAAVATGLIWGVWHFPLLARATELPGHPWLAFAVFPVATVFYSIVLGWLGTKSGSIWAPSLAHSAINNLRGPLIAMFFAAEPDRLGIALAGLAVFGAIALLIVACGGLKPTADPA
jgi:uncharacterized protein